MQKPRRLTSYKHPCSHCGPAAAVCLVFLAPRRVLGPVGGEPVDPVAEGEDVRGDEDDDDEGHGVEEEPGTERWRDGGADRKSVV